MIHPFYDSSRFMIQSARHLPRSKSVTRHQRLPRSSLPRIRRI